MLTNERGVLVSIDWHCMWQGEPSQPLNPYTDKDYDALPQLHIRTLCIYRCAHAHAHMRRNLTCPAKEAFLYSAIFETCARVEVYFYTALVL